MCLAGINTLVPIDFHISNIIIQGKPVEVLNRPVGNGPMISEKLITGSSINASKPTGVLNRLADSGSILSNIFKQGILVSASKPVGVGNKLAGSRAMLAWYQDKPVGVLNRPAGNGVISGKGDLVNALLYT